MRRPALLKLFLVLAVLAFVALTFAFARSEKVESEPAPTKVDNVVLFAVPNLGIDDVDPEIMPVLSRLSTRGAIAATNVRTKGDRPDVLEAYATLGAGNRVAIGEQEPPAPEAPDPPPDQATTSTDPSTTTTVVLDPVTGEPVGSRPIVATAQVIEAEAIGRPDTDPDMIVLREMGELLANADAGTDADAQPGSLAERLRRAGMRAAVVTNAGAFPLTPGAPVRAPAGVAAADRYGLIDRGSVGDDLLVPDPLLPGGVTADVGVHVDAVQDALEDSELVVVDAGETTRALETSALLGDDALAEEARLAALSRTDAVLGALAADLDARTLLVVVGVTPPGDRWALTPMVVTGAGTPRGYLHSSSTHRPDLVTLTDVAPTVLDALDVEPPAAMIGNPLAYRPGEADWNGALALDSLLERRAPIDRPMAVGFIVVQTIVYLLAIVVLVTDRPRPAWFDRALLLVVVTCAAWPLATFWLRIAPSLYSYGAGTFFLCWLVAAVVAFGVTRLRRHVLDPVLALCTLTVATLVADLATGAQLQYGSFFGYAPTTAPRFIGIGNAAFALLGGATVVICTALVARSKDRTMALWGGGAVAAIVVVADGAPWMGTDVGGILTLVPVLCLLFWSLSGRRVRWHTIGLAVVAAAVVLGAAVAIESLRDPGQRTHIGRFFLESGDGTTVQDTLSRKWSANMAVLRRSPLAWLVPIIAGVSFVAVASGRAWRRVLPIGSPERTGVTATLAMGFVGWILNDSGVVVLALASVFLGPYILLLAQAKGPRGTGATPAAGTVGPPMHDDPTHEAGLVTSTDRSDPSSSELPAAPLVVALVPAKDRADSVGDTVRALLAIDLIDRVLVIDDGSTDPTTEAARSAGADVLRLPRNQGKGGAVAAGAAATPDADVYLLIDADLARTADAADLLLGPVLRDEADLVVGVLPSAGGKGGFGKVRDFAARGIRRGCGLEVRAPLSGQRAIRAHLLRGLTSADRFGLEVAMTIDVVRRGGRVLEVDVPMDHRHTGRSLAGFAHRGRQGRDIARSLWPRLVPRRIRLGGLVAATALLCVFAVVLGSMQVPSTTPLGATPSRVLVFGMQPLSFDDLERGVTPNLQRLIDEGAVGALSVRTIARTPNDGEGYLSLGAGARLRGGGLVDTVLPVDAPVGSTTAADYVAAFTGVQPSGEFVVMGGAGLLQRNDVPESASEPGALGDALQAAGMTGAVVGNADQPETFTSDGYLSRPAALAVMTSDLGVPRGHIEPEEVLEADPTAPFGVRADAGAVVAAALDELERSELVVVDPGDLTRATRFGRSALSDPSRDQWTRALERSDDMLGRIIDGVDDDTLVLVVSVVPSGSGQRPTPLVAWGSGVPPGRITSPSTRQSGLSAITDLAPTILDALGLDVPVDLPGNAIRYEAGGSRLGDLRTLDADTIVREATYGPVSTRYIGAFSILYVLATLLVLSRRTAGRATPWLRRAALAVVAFPVATFLARLVPGLTTWFTTAQAMVGVALAVLIALAADRARRHPLSPLAWIAGLTIAVVVVDSWTGSRLHVSSWLGYSLHNAGRFYGIPNTTFAVLGGLTLLLAGIIVHHAERRSDALWKVGCLFTIVLASAGLPMLGADVGSLITLFPVFAVTLVALAGRRMQVRSLAIAGVAMVLLVGLAAGLDLTRPADQRSHLGQFTEELLDEGPSALVDTFTRKQSANFRLLGVSQWTRLVPVAIVFLAVPLVWQRRYRTLLPPGSALRVAFWSVVGATVLGFASNDSGPIVISLFLAQLPPFVLLLLLAGPDDGPELLPAASGAVVRSADSADSAAEPESRPDPVALR